MRKKNWFKLVIVVSVISMLSGCGSPSPAGDEQTGMLNGTDYITTADAKTIVLENSGLSEEQIQFVRFHLDADGDSASYDIEFVSGTAEYDYKLNAVTGEILSMNCELASLPLAGVAQESGQENRQENSQESTQESMGQNPQENLPMKGVWNGNAPASAEEQYIGREAAKQTALAHAGLEADSVNFTHVHLEFDDGRWQYDVEFHQGQEEYDYDIDAVTGEVLSHDHDVDYKKTLSNVGAGSERIGEETAKQLALEHAGVSESDAQSLKVEFDYDDGRAEYEVEWYVGRTEYACDVDAYTGAILSFKTELD